MPPTSKAHQRAVNKYMKNHYDRINYTVPKGQKITLQNAADASGESVNAFITRAVLAQLGLREWPEIDRDET